jgi:leader peptidase (prepilin peptidase)/N-methyltransferase
MINQTLYASVAAMLGGICGLLIAKNINHFPRVIFAQFEPESLDSLRELSAIGRMLVALAVGIIWLACFLKFGQDVRAVCWAIFGTTLAALAIIDARTFLLPDAVTQPLVWVGLLVSSSGWIDLPVNDAVIGAVVGYAGPWAFATCFRMVTGQEGMGAGDFKLMAAMGAWLGPLALLQVIFLASLLGAVVGISMKLLNRLDDDGYFPFGPSLVLGGLATAWFGVQLNVLLM